MTTGAIASVASSVEGVFGPQIEAFLLAQTTALNVELAAGLTDAEIATSAAVERKIIFAGINKAIAVATTPAK